MNAKTLLLVSLVLNLGLAVALVSRIRPGTNPQTFKSEEAVASAPKQTLAKPAPNQAADAGSSATEATKPPQAFDWRVVESEDYKKYIANLRSIGCPEDTIRDIISADVNKLFESRKQALRGTTNKFEYWKTGNFFASAMDEGKVKQSQELAREKRALLKELLGTVPEEKPDLLGGMNPFETLLDFLPAAKQQDIAEIFQNYQAKIMKSFSGGAPDKEDMKKIQALQKDMEAELAKTLTPEEFESYQLRMSQTAMTMRMQLAGFDPSEQEFRDIFKLKKKFDDEFGLYGMGTQNKAETEKRTAAEKELNAQVKSILGDTRYTEYERAQDWAYQGISRVAERNGLGKDAAVKVYDMKKAAEEQAAKVRMDTSLSAEQRASALAGIRAETENSARTVLGEKAWQSYQDQPTAHWLNNLSPSSQTTAPAK